MRKRRLKKGPILVLLLIVLAVIGLVLFLLNFKTEKVKNKSKIKEETVDDKYMIKREKKLVLYQM